MDHPETSSIPRREALSTLALGATALGALPGSAFAQDAGNPSPPSSSVGVGKHAIRPLPFNPGRLKGLSDRLLRSHHENNYASAVKSLNKVEVELASTHQETPPFLLAGLKERELVFTNSVILHEHYFQNLGGPGKPSGPIEGLLADTHGGFDRWEEQFRATGMSLAGGSGWVVLDFNLHTGEPRTYWSGNHSQALASAVPLLVMDLYEHAYALDFGAITARYIEAFFANVQWDEVNRRLERAQQAYAALQA